MEMVAEFLIELIVNPIGGFVRWIFFRKKPLKEYIKDDWEGNLLAVGLIVVVVAISWIVI